MRVASAFAITFGANCGSISTMSAPVARIFFEAGADQRAVLGGHVIADHRIGAELPKHQIGLGRDDRVVEALEHVGTSSPPTPRLITVIG